MKGRNDLPKVMSRMPDAKIRQCIKREPEGMTINQIQKDGQHET